MLQRLVYSCLFFLCSTALHGQEQQALSSISTRWNDSFVEWEIFCFYTDTLDETAQNEEEQCGKMQLRWLNMRDDWSEWDIEWGSLRGNIRQKWKDDPTEWELRTFTGEVVTMRASWRNDLSQWRITNNNISLNFRTRWSNQLDEWNIEGGNRGEFRVRTHYRDDPRDWLVDDTLDAEVPPAVRLALLFIAIFHGSPRQ
jgi:hypothetical protein